jgi:hypothetical protein
MFASVECPCSSKTQRKRNAEVVLHFPGLRGLDKPIVWAFPEVLVCLNCGSAVFALADAPLKVLGQAYTDDDLPSADNLAVRTHDT